MQTPRPTPTNQEVADYRVGIVGCGRPWRTEGHTGFGMGHAHAAGYEASPHTRVVAVADINLDNARTFQEEHNVDRIYGDYREMLAQEQLDIVSICTWPRLHAEMVIAAAQAGVRAIHCEKPIAPSWGESWRMVETCQERGVQLTFNHQRRFAQPYRRAKELLQAGTIGPLQRLEMSCDNLFDWGTHWFDMCFFYNDETPAEWVIGQIDPRDGKQIFGVPIEGQGLSHFAFRNGVRGTLTTGFGAEGTTNRLVGEQGMIEVDLRKPVPVRFWGPNQSGWTDLDLPHGEGGLADTVSLGVVELVDALLAGREPELAARRALQATELIFGTYQSSRLRRRIELPLRLEEYPELADAVTYQGPEA